MACLLKDQILKMDARVPRYTSYPTAPHFKTLDNLDTYVDWLKAIPEGSDISLYIHIPFCPKLCWYCGCNTKITKRYSPVENYAHLLLREIDILERYLGQDKSIANIHFGGGSPGMLRAQDFDMIMTKLRQTFEINDGAEIALELDPRNVTEGRVAAYAKQGVNRISLGVQDFDDHVLKSVNRQQPFHLSYDAIKLLRQYGIEGINLDLIYGLPHQTIDTMRKTIDRAILLDPERIAFFGYAHVPWVKKHMRLIDEQRLPDKSARYDLFQIGSQELEKAGYVAIGIDHFAKPDDPLCEAVLSGNLHRNFQGYTTDSCNTLIGLGVSSIGKLPNGYIQNAPDMHVYRNSILAGHLPAAKSCPINEDDKARSEIIEKLMCNFTADISQISAKYGFDAEYFAKELDALKSYEALDFIKIDNSVIIIKANAKLMARSICAVFDSYLSLADSSPRHAKAI